MAALLTPARAQQAPLQDKPFAEHKIVLQLSDNDPKKQGLVISVALLLLLGRVMAVRRLAGG